MVNKSKEHLDCVGETYLEHMGFAFCFACKLIGAGLAVIAHAICPAIFQETGSRTIFKLSDELRARAASRHVH